jgi:hypothetical protein
VASWQLVPNRYNQQPCTAQCDWLVFEGKADSKR